jgi:hypothetical protein
MVDRSFFLRKCSSQYWNQVFWVVIPGSFAIGYQHSGFHPEVGDNKVLWNIGILLHNYMVSQPRRPWFEYSPLWKPHLASNRNSCIILRDGCLTVYTAVVIMFTTCFNILVTWNFAHIVIVASFYFMNYIIIF